MVELTALIVRDRTHGRTVYCEHFQSGDLPPGEATRLTSERVVVLARQYPVSKYEVLIEHFGSLEAYRRAHPDWAGRSAATDVGADGRGSPTPAGSSGEPGVDGPRPARRRRLRRVAAAIGGGLLLGFLVLVGGTRLVYGPWAVIHNLNLWLGPPKISTAVLAKDVKADLTAVDVTDTFPPDQPAIFVVIGFDNTAAGAAVKAVWTAVDVGPAAAPNTTFRTSEHTIKEGASGKYAGTVKLAIVRPRSGWPPGRYQVDVSLAGRAHTTLTFTVQPNEAKVFCPTLNAEADQAFSRAIDLHQGGRLDEAQPLYLRAVELNPRFCDAMNHLGRLLQRRGDVDGAVAWLQKSIAISPRNRLGHYHLGHAYWAKGKLHEAQAEFRLLTEIAPDDPDGYLGFGGVLLSLDQPREAIPPLKTAEALYAKTASPWLADARRELGVAHARLGEWRTARDYLEQALGAIPNDPRLNYFLGLAYLTSDLKDPARARTHLAKAKALGVRIPAEIARDLGF